MKILLVRFSSIGDIVLTSPVIRCLKQQHPEVELHYLTKSKFKTILEHNPYLDKLHCIEKSPSEVITQLKAERFDYVIDLHNNIRTLKLKWSLGVKSKAFPKLNFKKWMLVYFKTKNMPKLHVVDRYFEAVKFLNVSNDRQGCDYFIADSEELNPLETFGFSDYGAVAVGAQYATKKMPLSKLLEVLEAIDFPLVLLGDRNDAAIADEIKTVFPQKQIVNACGKFSLNQSASIVRQSRLILTHDTGLMHIASAFGKKIVSVWGNTVPELGMYPYMPEQKDRFSIHQVPDLSCRPCSKIGFKSCPKKHFNCMNLQDAAAISRDLNERFEA